MKKLIVLIVAFVAVTAYAQSPRVEVQVTDQGLGRTLTPKTKLSDSTIVSLNKALERAIATNLIKAKKDSLKVDTIKAKKPVKRYSKAQWLRAIFLNGPFPGESPEAYRYRLQMQSYPASQPFK